MSTRNDEQDLGLKGRRALVVDDSRAIRSMLRRLLQGLGFEVAEAGNGAEALQRLEDGDTIDLALVDWNMPIMDGLEFVKALRADRRFSDVVVLMVSSESDPAKVARALMKGADDYIIKPLTADVLVSKLTMLDTWHGARRRDAMSSAGAVNSAAVSSAGAVKVAR
jgi:two-component system chemotaxis response regulator CheY